MTEITQSAVQPVPQPSHALTFSSKEAIRFSFETTKKHFFFLLGISVVTWVAEYLPSFLTNSFRGRSDTESMIFIVLVTLVTWIITIGIALGYMRIRLALVEGKRPAFSALFDAFETRLILFYVGASLLSTLIIVGGYILLIIPGILFSFRLMFVGYSIADKGMGPIEAIKHSWQITNGKFWKLCGFISLLLLINLGGLLALGVGLLFTIPLSSLATAYVYRKLSA